MQRPGPPPPLAIPSSSDAPPPLAAPSSVLAFAAGVCVGSPRLLSHSVRSALEARLGRAWEDAGIVMERLTWARHHGDLLAEQRGRAAKAEGLRSWHCGGSC